MKEQRCTTVTSLFASSHDAPQDESHGLHHNAEASFFYPSGGGPKSPERIRLGFFVVLGTPMRFIGSVNRT